MDIVENNFQTSVRDINNLTYKPTDYELLILYGLYKQSLFGDNIENKPCFFKTPALVAKILFGQMGEELILSGQRVCPFKLNECGFNFSYYNLDLAFQNIFSQ